MPVLLFVSVDSKSTNPLYGFTGLMSSLIRFEPIPFSVYIACMSKLGERVREAREALGMDQTQLGEATGYTQTSISDIEVGTTVSPRNWRHLADTLKIDREEFRQLMIESGKVAGKTTRLPAGVRSRSRAAFQDLGPGPLSIRAEVAPIALSRDVPVFGRARGGDDGRYIFNGEVIGWEVRPPQLEGVRDAYATYIDGESMWPRYKPGETVWLNPHKPAGRGDDVVVQLRGGDEHEPPYGFIKEFVRKTPTKLILAQYNPAAEIEFDLGDVVSIHPIVFSQRS